MSKMCKQGDGMYLEPVFQWYIHYFENKIWFFEQIHRYFWMCRFYFQCSGKDLAFNTSFCRYGVYNLHGILLSSWHSPVLHDIPCLHGIFLSRRLHGITRLYICIIYGIYGITRLYVRAVLTAQPLSARTTSSSSALLVGIKPASWINVSFQPWTRNCPGQHCPFSIVLLFLDPSVFPSTPKPAKRWWDERVSWSVESLRPCP